MFTKPLSDRGSALVSVVGVLAVLAVVATGSALVTQSNARLLQKRTDSTKAFYVAEAGLSVGESALLSAIKAGETWPRDESLQDENAYQVAAPIESLAEVDPRLEDLKIYIDVISAAGVYKIRSSVSLASAGNVTATTATAALSKLVSVSPSGGGEGGGIPPDLVVALNEGIISDRNIDVGNNAYIRGSAHANGTVTVGKNVVITLGHTSGLDMLVPVPTILDITAHAESLAESTRSGYSGDWTSDPNDLVGNVLLTDNLRISNNRVINANLWIEGDLTIRDNVRVLGDIFVEGDLTLGNNVDLQGKVFVRGSASLGNNAAIAGPVCVYEGSGTLVCNNVTINDSLMAASDVEIRNNVVIRGSVLSSGSVSFYNNATLGRDDYGVLVYSAGDATVKQNVSLTIAAMIAHGNIDIENNAVIYESGSGIDPTALSLFPGGGAGSLIIDKHWGG